MTEVACNHLFVVGAGTENCHQVVSSSVRLSYSSKSLLSTAVILSKDLSKSSVVAYRVAECASCSVVVASLDVVSTKTAANNLLTHNSTKLIISKRKAIPEK